MDDEELIAVLTEALAVREQVVAATEGMLADAVAERDRVRRALRCLQPDVEHVAVEPVGDVTVKEPAAYPPAPAEDPTSAVSGGKSKTGRRSSYDYAAVARVANEALAKGEPMGTAVRLAFRQPSGSAAAQLIGRARRAGFDIGSAVAPSPAPVTFPGTGGNYLSTPDPSSSEAEKPEPVGVDDLNVLGWAEASGMLDEARSSVALDGDTRSYADVIPLRHESPTPLPADFTPANSRRHFECADDACIHLEFGTTRELTAHTVAEHGRPPTPDEKAAIEPRPGRVAE